MDEVRGLIGVVGLDEVVCGGEIVVEEVEDPEDGGGGGFESRDGGLKGGIVWFGGTQRGKGSRG